MHTSFRRCVCVYDWCCSFLQAIPSPRGLKSHLPYKLVPGGEPGTTAAKYISVYRNPKDTAVSSYHQFRNLFAPEMSWDEHFEEFLSPKMSGPSGKCLEYYLEWWKHKGKFLQHGPTSISKQTGWDQMKPQDVSSCCISKVQFFVMFITKNCTLEIQQLDTS